MLQSSLTVEQRETSCTLNTPRNTKSSFIPSTILSSPETWMDPSTKPGPSPTSPISELRLGKTNSSSDYSSPTSENTISYLDSLGYGSIIQKSTGDKEPLLCQKEPGKHTRNTTKKNSISEIRRLKT